VARPWPSSAAPAAATRPDETQHLLEEGLAAREVEQALALDTLPKLNQLLSGVSQNSDTLQEFLEQLKEQPQSVLFGAQSRPPGPGERGFTPPRISQ
jgi:phospholipid/cholesterol/gamma-HCH transport system substrate-binding protein